MNYAAKLGAVSAVALMIGAVGASANTLTINSVIGAWSNPSFEGVTIDNSPTIASARWGVPTGSAQSGYDFVGASGSVQNEGADFVLGDFTHHNWPITGTFLTSIDLDVIVNVEGHGDILSKFTFSHEETPNEGPCFEGSVSACDDIVTPELNFGATDTFFVDGVEYVFTVSGFMLDGVFSDKFWTEENQSNTAQLVGSFVSKTSPVPVPAAGWLMFAGLGGLAALRRKRKAAQ